jgi:hypothetical protein
MGLCQCRGLSSLFCYEHKRNVCESCLTTDGPTELKSKSVTNFQSHQCCYVRPYLSWLSDETFVNGCRSCGQEIELGQQIRLPCYDIYHINCLVKLLKQMYGSASWSELKCPDCKSLLYGGTGPIARQVQTKLANLETPWKKELSNMLFEQNEIPKPTLQSNSPITSKVEPKIVLGPIQPKNSNYTAVPIPEYLKRRISPQSAIYDFQNLRQIIINCLTGRNIRFSKLKSPRALLSLLIVIAVTFIVYYNINWGIEF